MPTKRLWIIGCAAVTVVLMSFAAPMAANAAVLQEDYFTEATIEETSFEHDGVLWTLDTVNDELDFGPDGTSALYWPNSATEAVSDDGVWTLSFDVRIDFDETEEDNLFKIPIIAQNDNLLEIQLKPSAAYTNDLEFAIEDHGGIFGEDTDVTQGLDANTWYHMDLVFNRTGSEVLYNDFDVAAGNADLWIDGVIGMWGIVTEADGQYWELGEVEDTYSTTTGSFDNWVIRDEAGRMLRRYADTNADNRVDVWCYFFQGIEVYRDIDADFNGKADQYRWLGTGGTRSAVDRNEDGVIDKDEIEAMKKRMRERGNRPRGERRGPRRGRPENAE